MTPFPSVVGRRSILAGAVLLAGLPIANAVDVAGSLLINLDASTLTPGLLPTWQNTGALGATFTATGTPTVEVVGGVKSVLFDGRNEYMAGPLTTGTSVEGLDPNRTVEVWVYDGNIQGEESLVAWGHRGGPDGTNVAFSYGSNSAWGAVGHWGGSDIGWDAALDNSGQLTPNVPTRGQWHHLVYTYDGRVDSTVAAPSYTTRLYVDGVQVNQETLGPGVLNTFANNAFVLGSQTNNDGVTIEAAAARALTGALAKVRVHSGVLTAAQVLANYNAEKGEFLGKATSAVLTAGPIHRYSFNNPAGTVDPANPAQVLDSVGTAHGQVVGNGAMLTGTGVDLPGGSSQTQAYIDLPNGILTQKPNGSPMVNVTLETWVTVSAGQTWSRILDFGSNSFGDVPAPGGDFQGTNYVILSNNIGDSADQRFERVGGSLVGGGNDDTFRDSINSQILNQEIHVAITYDATLQEWKWYQNGILMQALPDTFGLSAISDVNNWLGRSNWSGDANTDATYNEFRIYDYALSEAQILGNFTAGPNVVNVPEPGTSLLLGTALAGLVGSRRRRRK